MAAAVHGIFFGRIAPSSQQRRSIEVPAIVIGHPNDPVHPAADAAMLADELPNATFVPANSFLEWRRRPDRISAEVVAFLRNCWPTPVARDRRTTAGRRTEPTGRKRTARRTDPGTMEA
jgi:hypothetical protein